MDHEKDPKDHGKDPSLNCEDVPRSESGVVSVLLTCGLPASGKSTLVNDVRHQLHSYQHESGKYDQVLVIEYDSIEQNIFQELLRKDANDIRGGSGNADKNSSRSEIEESFRLDAWRKTRFEALRQLDTTLHGLNKRSDEHRKTLIILDDNFHLRSMRWDVYKTCQRHVFSAASVESTHHKDRKIETSRHPSKVAANAKIRIGFSVMMIDVPLQVCLERNGQRGKEQLVSDEVILKMFNALEPPKVGAKSEDISAQSKCDERRSLRYNGVFEQASIILQPHSRSQEKHHDDGIISAKFGLDPMVLSQIKKCLDFALTDHPVQPPYDNFEERKRRQQEAVDDRQITQTNSVHLVDAMLRAWVGITCRCIGDIVQECGSTVGIDKKQIDLASYRKNANIARKTILQDFRTKRGEIQDGSKVDKSNVMSEKKVSGDLEMDLEGLMDKFVSLVIPETAVHKNQNLGLHDPKGRGETTIMRETLIRCITESTNQKSHKDAPLKSV